MNETDDKNNNTDEAERKQNQMRVIWKGDMGLKAKR